MARQKPTLLFTGVALQSQPLTEEKPIRLSRHAEDYCDIRGFTADEVEQVIRTTVWLEAGRNSRMECRKDFPYNLWNGKRYVTKQVRPVFVEEPEEIVVITVYTYYF